MDTVRLPSRLHLGQSLSAENGKTRLLVNAPRCTVAWSSVARTDHNLRHPLYFGIARA